MSLKFISLNIEGRKHLDLVIPFLEKEMPDVVCLQELCDIDVVQLNATLGSKSLFEPMSRENNGYTGVSGIGIFSRAPILQASAQWYGGSQEDIPLYDGTSFETMHASIRATLATCDVQKDGVTYRVATTHFPVTDKGKATEYQREDMKRLLEILGATGDFVLCGDFNAPRGGQIFSVLADRYADNIPPQYATSLDLALHRAGKDRPQELADKMVDGLFSTPGYRVSDVSLVSGVSDHCAVVASISPAMPELLSPNLQSRSLSSQASPASQPDA